MLYIFIVYLLLCLYKISFKNVKSIDEDALLHNRTMMINGIFVGIVFFSHFSGVVALSGYANTIFVKILKKIGQLMVTTFLFYSGYGILESIKNKPDYMKTFFKNRIVKLFVSFSLAICLYLVLNWILGISKPVNKILLSFIGWESVGNSNWFIFATFCLYFIVLISFNIFKEDNLKAILLSIIGTLLYILFIIKVKRLGYWCDTALCFNLGMLISYFKDKLILFLKDNINYLLTFMISLCIFGLCYLQGYNFIIYTIYSLSFVFLIFMLSLKIKIGNNMLLFLGKNTFNIYILQRVSFILFGVLGLKNHNVYLYFLVSVIFTLFLIFVFNKLIKIVCRIFKLS